MILDVLEWYMHVKGFSYVRLDGSTNVSAGLGCTGAVQLGPGLIVQMGTHLDLRG